MDVWKTKTRQSRNRGAAYQLPSRPGWSDKHKLSKEMGLKNNLAPPPATNDRYRLFFHLGEVCSEAQGHWITVDHPSLKSIIPTFMSHQIFPCPPPSFLTIGSFQLNCSSTRSQHWMTHDGGNDWLNVKHCNGRDCGLRSLAGLWGPSSFSELRGICSV